MKKSYYLLLLFYSSISNAQVGIGTINPQATLDIREANPAAPTAQAGIAISQVSILPTTGNRAGQLIYLTTSNAYYFYNGVSWNPLLTSASASTFGDVKNGYQTSDHNGWVLLNGRLLSTLTASQQVVAASLNFSANLPNTADKSIVGASTTKTLNTTGGVDAMMLNRDQLPDFSINTIPGQGAHAHLTFYYLFHQSGASYVSPPYTPLSHYYSGGYYYPNNDGAHVHSTESINGGVPQNAVNIQNPYIAMNSFIYLGL